MKKQIPIVKGARSFFPEEMAFRTWLYEKIRGISEVYGYEEYDGPFLETLDLYAAKSGDEIVRKQAFVFEDRGGESITLRPELTPSLARMIAERQGQLATPLRWWSFGPFWRYESPQKGRSREFFQWNIDLMGVETLDADLEICAVAAGLLKNLGLTPRHIKIYFNNRTWMDEQFSRWGIGEGLRKDILHLIDRKEKISLASWQAEMEKIGLPTGSILALSDFLEQKDRWQESPYLVSLQQALAEQGIQDYFEYKPTVIRGLDYYTGLVFEARDVAGEFRAILGGGRYDNLVMDVGGSRLPGIGFAMGDMVVALAMEKFGLMPKLRSKPTQVLVVNFSEEYRKDYWEVARELRARGIATEFFPKPDRIPKQLKYADAAGIRLAVLIGEDEIREQIATCKDLVTHEQFTFPRSGLCEEIQHRLAPSHP
jgi:histidyl-tRNA synthetase